MADQAVLTRIEQLEHACFGESSPTKAKVRVLTGTADHLGAFTKYLVASVGVNNMTIDIPTPGGPGIGKDGETMTIYNVSPNADQWRTAPVHTITAPAAIMRAASDMFASNPSLTIVTAQYALPLQCWVKFLAWNGSLLVVDWNGGGGVVQQWTANTIETVGVFIVDSNGHIQSVTSITGNGMTGSVAPTWATTLGATTVDNFVTWTRQ